MDLSRFWLSAWPVLPVHSPEPLLAALVSALATLMLVIGFTPRLAATFGRRPSPAEPCDGGCEYLINGASLKALSEPARALLAALPAGGSRLAALAGHFAGDCPTLRADLESLVLYGTGFRHHCPRGDGTAFEIRGEPRGGAAYLSIRAASEEARALKDAEAALARARGELGFLRDVLDRAPVLAWSRGPDGQVAWANAAYRDRFDARGGSLPDHRIADGFGHVIEEVPLTARGQGARRRLAVPGRDGEPRWYEVSEAPAASGELTGFALGADDLVAVVDASGMLVFVNSAFERLWGLDPMQRLDGPGVAEMTAIWAERCGPSPVWGEVAEFATAADARTVEPLHRVEAPEPLEGRVDEDQHA